MNKIKSGDEVIVLTGNDRGKTGQVIRVLDKGERMLVQGIKLVKKHVKPNPQLNQQGGIISKEAPIQTSNLAIYNSATKKADRVGFKTLEDNKKVRIFKSTGEMIDL